MSAPPRPIGVVGLGLVGTALAQRLKHAGFTVLGYDHAAPARDAFSSQGGTAASDLSALAGCDCVILAVFDTDGVTAVVNALLDAAGPAPSRPVPAFIDCSTGDPDRLQALAQKLASRGTDFIEAPLSGSSQQIAAGEATLLLGADAHALARHGAVLRVLSPRRIHAGGAGMGARAKLATNLVLGLNRAALAEGMVFAERLGIEPARFLEMVLATPASSGAALAKGALMVSGDFTPQSRIRQHLKDVHLMLAAARAAGQALPLSSAHAQLMQDAVAAGDGDLDNAGIIRQIRRATSGGPSSSQ